MAPMIDTFVTDDEHAYPARLDPDLGRDGWIVPLFTLDTVRQIAAHTQEHARQYGPDRSETIHVIDHEADHEGSPYAVVVHIVWQYLEDGAQRAATIVEPNDEGRYAIGAEWSWNTVDDGPLFNARRAAHEAGVTVLNESVRRVGEILRELAPGITEVVVDFTDGRPRTYAVGTDGALTWSVLSESGPFDTETLGEADQVLLEAGEFSPGPKGFWWKNWQQLRNNHGADLYLVRLPPAVSGEDTETSAEK